MPQVTPPEREINMLLGNRIRMLRRKSGIKQPVVAKFMGVSEQMIQYYETGRIRVSAYRLKQFCEIYSVDVRVMFMLTELGVGDD